MQSKKSGMEITLLPGFSRIFTFSPTVVAVALLSSFAFPNFDRANRSATA